MSCSAAWSGRFGTLSRQARLTLVVNLPLSGGWVARVLGGTLSEGATLFNLAVLTGAAIEGFRLAEIELRLNGYLLIGSCRFVGLTATIIK